MFQRSSHEQRSLSTSMAQGPSWLPYAQDTGVSGSEAGEAICDYSGHSGEGETMNSKENSKNKARVRTTLRLLRSVKCDNFRVVGIANWTSPVDSLAGTKAKGHTARATSER